MRKRSRFQPRPRHFVVLACLAAQPLLAAAAPSASAEKAYYDGLRAQLKWVPVQVDGRERRTPDPKSRLLLARSAAERAGLSEVGLDFRDVYGVINAETSWVPRTGMGRNGVASHGLAQFEPATARALGVANANDPVEAVHAAATLLKEAAQWSARRIAGLGLSGADYAKRLREGVSIYYNLSSRARERWNGTSTAALPVETQRHIANVRVGARQAELLQGGRTDLPAVVAQAAAAAKTAPAVKLASAGKSSPAAKVLLASAEGAKPARPVPLGTIAWSGQGGDADAAPGRRGEHVVWSDGTVTRGSDGRVRWTSSTPG
jgi:hypothetical protein